MKQIGKVTHYYGKIGVAIIELKGGLKVGDKVRIKKGETEFDQEVSSIELEHKSVQEAKKGDAVGIKVDEKAREGAVVHKLEEGD